MKPLRIAFVTPEFVTDCPEAGGLASYLARITKALRDLGHQPEIFTISPKAPCQSIYHGIPVHGVAPVEPQWLKAVAAGLHLHWRLPKLNGLQKHLRAAMGLALALDQRQRDNPFDIVQSSDWGLTGLFVKRLPGRTHLVRSSSCVELIRRAQGLELDDEQRWYLRLERWCMWRADAVYAPSQFAADHHNRKPRMHVRVVRPPAALECEPSADLPADLPPQYLLHPGKLWRVKGTDVLAEALPLAWQQAPDLRMVWAGHEAERGFFETCASKWGDQRHQVTWVGGVARPVLYGLIQRAIASVLPTRCDNLPNAAIESLLLDVPVIGTHGASIDELVTPGESGLLVPIGNAQALADALVESWRGGANWLRDPQTGFRRPEILLDEMNPRRAAQNVLDLAVQPLRVAA